MRSICSSLFLFFFSFLVYVYVCDTVGGLLFPSTGALVFIGP